MPPENYLAWPSLTSSCSFEMINSICTNPEAESEPQKSLGRKCAFQNEVVCDSSSGSDDCILSRCCVEDVFCSVESPRATYGNSSYLENYPQAMSRRIQAIPDKSKQPRSTMSIVAPCCNMSQYVAVCRTPTIHLKTEIGNNQL